MAAATTSTSAGAASASTAAPTAPAPQITGNVSDAPTIFTTLHTLLRAHCQAHPSPTMPYLHPYAPLPPAPWKGKARASLPSPEAQGDALRAMREVVDSARGVLGRRDDPDRVRLARAMREVITHESALLPLATTLASLPPAQRSLEAIVPLPPSELLSALGKRLGLQVFAEDSQFGLLKTSLTLAGSRFVVDVDLESDAVEGDESEPPTATATPVTATAAGFGMLPTAPPVPSAPKTLADGRVRLSKLTASHVTPAGEAGKSAWIERVLRSLVEEHLKRWNAQKSGNEADCLGTCAALETALAELKALDDLAEAASGDDADLFADLEMLAEGVVKATEQSSDPESKVYADPKAGIYPSFRLLDTAPGRNNPALRFRPVGKGETATPPPETEEENGMAVDGASPETMCRGAWLVEVVDDAAPLPAGGHGLVVRRTWLQPDVTEADALSAGIKVEGLLYQAALEDQSSESALPLFPYNTAFTSSPDGGLKQLWSLMSPGPDGFVVGRVGLPKSWKEFGCLVTAMRAQLVLNVLFATAFDPPKAQSGPFANGTANGTMDEDDDDAMDLAELDAPPTAVPVTATLHLRAMRASFPFPSADAEPPTVTLELRPTSTSPYLELSWDAEPALDDASKSKMDAAVASAAVDVDVVTTLNRVLGAL